MITGEIKSKMEFIALNVEEGDSFILKNQDKVVVVDGGKLRGNKKGTSKNPIVIDKLAANNITNIDVLICTHYDSDHINGIIEIIESKQHKVTELWLPDVFGDIDMTLSKKENRYLLCDFCHSDFPNNEKIESKTSIFDYVEKNQYLIMKINQINKLV